MVLLKSDPWQQICEEVQIDPDSMPFVSRIIGKDVIGKFGQPRLLIPIYSDSAWSRFPFLRKNGLIPLRVGIGSAVLTKASLLLPIPEIADRTCTLHCYRESVPSSLLVPVSTEAKYLALAFETGVFKAALEIPDSSRVMQGIFGKMNLSTANISLQDTNGNMIPVALTNVQFELDYCLETSTDVYLFEAKTDNSTSFSLLQLFYPFTMVRDFAERTGRKTHTILVKISAQPEAVTYAFHEYRFPSPSIVNVVEREASSRVELKIESNNSQLTG